MLRIERLDNHVHEGRAHNMEFYAPIDLEKVLTPSTTLDLILRLLYYRAWVSNIFVS